MKTHYDVLGVAPDSDRDVLRRAYLDLARRHHPDAGGDAAAMLAVNDAWAVLSDPRRRAHYDRSIGRPAAAVPTGDDGFGADLGPDPEGLDDPDDLDDLGAFDDHGAPRAGRASSTIDAVTLLAVLVLGAAAALALLFGMILTIGELLGFGVFLAFLTGIATLARMLVAMRTTGRSTAR